MTLTVLIFGPIADAAQTDRLHVRVPPNPTAGQVLSALKQQHPTLGPIPSAARLAINHAFATPDAVISADDELALIALVGGG